MFLQGNRLCSFWNISLFCQDWYEFFYLVVIYLVHVFIKYSSSGALLKIRQLNYSFAVYSEMNCSNWMVYYVQLSLAPENLA